MPEVCTYVSVSCVCGITLSGYKGEVGTIEVEPCPVCLMAKYHEGFHEGREEARHEMPEY